jgi:ubiquinol-cytochrome c reductase cytochrome c subunit
MPSFVYVLSVPEMRAVSDYVAQQLAVIPLAGGNLSEGGKLFRVYCATCHRTAVRGGALAFTGLNAPALTDKSAAIIAGTIRWGPGPMPAFPASVLTNKQLNSIVDYVKFVQHPPSPGGSPLNWYGPVAEGFAAWVIVFAIVVMTGWIERGGKG